MRKVSAVLCILIASIGLYLASCNTTSDQRTNSPAPVQDIPDWGAPPPRKTAPRPAPPRDISFGNKETPAIQALPEGAYHRVDVLYGTSRARTGEEDPNAFYGIERGQLEYGVCQVSIPLDHEVGQLESPTWWKFEFSEDPEDHLMLRQVVPLEWDSFTSALRQMADESEGSNAFVFIHGYNVTFRDAARRTAQIHHDLKFDGVPTFFSWPSQGEITLTSYTRDETNAKWSYSLLEEFLAKFADESEVENLYLVAHSMGTRVLSNAIADLMQNRPELEGRFKEIILAAPDIDADVFKKDLAPRLQQAALNTTLYANEDDRALMTSREVHGGYPRAGDAGENLVVIEGIDTIDATGTDSSLLRHSYFAEAFSIIEDIREMVNLSKPADQRSNITPANSADGNLPYYRVQSP
ncbi:alpha/beta hydrolase [Pelagicoccus mobilis]|uniref:Alpha/beta hydrolase n=1 Tax=Pelagicoccus mobilis TaxID=415221 RepID=A0A934RYN2_9BACT|nr:alpha/beta hydrolase [Pelagicoccus mobilis]MBK1876264.1 alpha/beta hydrolase [Pelagicoccus mobilis]